MTAEVSGEPNMDELDIKPNGYVDHLSTDEDTGHGRKTFEGQSIHGDSASRVICNWNILINLFCCIPHAPVHL